jgi:hypothetical protein
MIAITSTTKGMSRKMVWHWDSAFDRRIISIVLCMIFTSKRTAHLKKKSNKSMYAIECTDQNCHWRLYASRMLSDDAFIINTRQDHHECIMLGDRLEYPHLTYPFMTSLIRESVKDNVRFTIKDIKVVIEQRYSFKAPYLKCWRAKEITIA